MAARKKQAQSGPTPVDSIHHEDKRVNIPTADAHELLDEDAARPGKLLYPRDPSLDPQLVWDGKDEQDADDLVVDAPPIYVQEKIEPQVIIENLRRTAAKPEEEPELILFDDFDGLEGLEAVEYYQHEANWSNRMILGDSLQVMGSLAEKENLRGKVQTIYIDPPYGINFGSNWQVSTSSRRVDDGKRDHATREVEQIKAFRDTWEKGIHSYLAYLRDRLVVARDLLTESGSIFVQIGDENVHLVRSIMDEVFGSDCHVVTILVKKKGSQRSGLVDPVNDYILWYSRNPRNEQPGSRVKYRQLFEARLLDRETTDEFTRVELPDGSEFPLRAVPGPEHELQDYRLNPLKLFADYPGARLFRPWPITNGGDRPNQKDPIELDGREYRPPKGCVWRHMSRTSDGSIPGMERLRIAQRLVPSKTSLDFKRYLDDFPYKVLSNWWDGLGGASDQVYVVQTNPRIVERCLLMTTDPGDLVLDPTCGSGTTAYVAEQWGRRWITIDTSRVALALARQRLMGAYYPYYLLADSPEGQRKEEELTGRPGLGNRVSFDVHKGFIYQRARWINSGSIANNPDIQEGMSRDEIDRAIRRHANTELLYDRPYEDKNKVRVAGRFTVESLSPHRAVAPERETGTEQSSAEDSDSSAFERTVLENLEKAGVQTGRKAERLEFESVTPFAGERIQAEGARKDGTEDTPQRIGVSIGPQYGTVDPEWIRKAAKEATRGQGFDVLLICGFAFDPQAVETTEEFAPQNGSADFATVAEERKLGRLPVLLVRMNSDLAMGDVLLKKTGSANLFTVFGEPDVAIERTDEGVVVEIKGIDVYDPTTGEIRSSDTGDIALWMIDTDYDGESFFVRHCYFTGNNDPYTRLKKTLKADIDEAAWQTLYSTRSRPFAYPDSGKIAIKVINHYGDEVLKVYEV